MRQLYPPLQPYVSHTLTVDSPHQLHVEECGNPDGIPVLFLHGGPGSGCEKYHRSFFDPERYRIVLFDQRGCGKSTPHAALEGNTTQALVADIETIRQQLGIERWMVFGGSWGSTLALVYAETYPDRVAGLILRGIFLCRPEDIDWFYQSGADRLCPDQWQQFIAPIPEVERHEMVNAYYRRLTGDDEVAAMSAAKAWSLWEGYSSTLLPKRSVVDHFGDPHTAVSLARIEAHYFVNDSFLEPNQILRDAGKLAGIPGVIVHGRYDLVCPLSQAWALHQAWPEAQLEVIADAGHSATEPGIVDALIRASDAMAGMLA
ncbi:prolyl aminopeptidase [Solemya pervernicosa gill symbiont]|uniref:Proline iminopeptidase n=2 Tax=Gammaproteobacteria incertae sedis TaxID=118884 RepID=A0A1T2L788_9GAMM|nr:prolyl aminopeptidase [Candidatus Reidiella endopervernicosa]OOZ40978.1 prolyl aminopeptidase [Solemya pervernicosa gill symbiont]QKQ25028.1 prolyl aminopeptidase [Candidatus Reidiella endopervernicosa]